MEIGLGRIGASRSRRWIAAGQRVVGNVRMRETVATLVADGAYVDATLEQVLPLPAPGDRVLSALRFGFGGHLEKAAGAGR